MSRVFVDFLDSIMRFQYIFGDKWILTIILPIFSKSNHGSRLAVKDVRRSSKNASNSFSRKTHRIMRNEDNITQYLGNIKSKNKLKVWTSLQFQSTIK